MYHLTREPQGNMIDTADNANQEVVTARNGYRNIHVTFESKNVDDASDDDYLDTAVEEFLDQFTQFIDKKSSAVTKWKKFKQRVSMVDVANKVVANNRIANKTTHATISGKIVDGAYKADYLDTAVEEFETQFTQFMDQKSSAATKWKKYKQSVSKEPSSAEVNMVDGDHGIATTRNTDKNIDAITSSEIVDDEYNTDYTLDTDVEEFVTQFTQFIDQKFSAATRWKKYKQSVPKLSMVDVAHQIVASTRNA